MTKSVQSITITGIPAVKAVLEDQTSDVKKVETVSSDVMG